MEPKDKLTKTQHEILRHALGWPKPYRNHFVTGEGSTDYDDCERLVAMGMMMRKRLDWVPDYIYVTTDKGREAAATEFSET